jgi:acetolactate synthase-1/2/3 large subunit
MTGLELMTAASYGAGVVVCLLRDGELAQIAQFQRTLMAEVANSVLPPYDARAFAQTTGTLYVACADDLGVEHALQEAFATARGGRPVLVDVAIDYSRKTHFTRGVVSTTFWRLPWRDRLRMLGRAASRHLARRLE